MAFNSKYTGQEIEDMLDVLSSGSVNGGGYPVITVTDNFNIQAQPNIFYNIKNTPNDEVDIDIIGEELFVEDQDKHIMFTGELQYVENDVIPEEDFVSGLGGELLLYLSCIGGIIIQCYDLEGYTYKLFINGSKYTGQPVNVTFYFSNQITQGGSVNCLCNIVAEGENIDIPFIINNINILTQDVDYLVLGSIAEQNFNNLPHVFIEIENDNESYNYKYEVVGFFNIYDIYEVYTNEPYYQAENFYEAEQLIDLKEIAAIKVIPNKYVKGGNIANEFVFNINCPANLSINQNIKWAASEPDLSDEGTCTISLVNGVGCYTFVN